MLPPKYLAAVLIIGILAGIVVGLATAHDPTPDECPAQMASVIAFPRACP